MSEVGDDLALDLLAEHIHDVAKTIEVMLTSGGMSDRRVPSHEEICDRVSELFVQLCEGDASMIHRYPLLLVKRPNANIGVYLEMGTIPEAVFNV